MYKSRVQKLKDNIQVLDMSMNICDSNLNLQDILAGVNSVSIPTIVSPKSNARRINL